MSPDCPYTLSPDSTIAALQQRWLADRVRRRRHMPPARSYRGCVGLAMLLERPDDTEYYGERALISNDHVTRLALRDVPPGHFPGSGPMHRRGVSYANATKATLRYGLPKIDLSRPDARAVDFRFFPGQRRYGPKEDRMPIRVGGDVLEAEERTDELGALVQLSEAMTRSALNRYGRHPRDRSRADWMPTPYLAFDKTAVQLLVNILVAAPPLALRDAACDAACSGLPLVAADDLTYIGTTAKNANARELGHVFRKDSGAVVIMRVPHPAELLVRQGEQVRAGQAWCHLLAKSESRVWCQLPRPRRWPAFCDSVGGRAALQRLLDSWINHGVAVHLASRPDLTLFPAELVAVAVQQVLPNEMWWDIAPTAPYLEGVCAAFPPVPLQKWNRLRLRLSGGVDVNAGIGDPRFNPSAPPHQRSAQTERRAVRMRHEIRSQLALAG